MRKLLTTFTLLVLFTLPIRAQVVDELHLQSTTYIGVGEDSVDYAAQSFFADVWNLTRFGIWLKREATNSFVRIAFAHDNGMGRPDLDSIIVTSANINPNASGGFSVISGLSQWLQIGKKYWVIVDGYNNGLATGYAGVGISGTYTDTGENMIISHDGGSSWSTINDGPMAILVEGDTCRVPLDIGMDTTWCENGTSLTLDAGAGYTSYNWSTGETSRTISVDSSGTYMVFAIDGSNCVATDTVIVTIHPKPDPGLEDEGSFCTTVGRTLVTNPAFTSVLWSTGQTTFFINVPSAGTYWVAVTDTNGCSARDTIVLTEFPLPQVDLGNDTTVCIDGLLIDAGPGFDSYTWSTGDTTQTITVDSAQSIHVTVIDTNGCENISNTVEVTVFVPPVAPPITVTATQLVTLNIAGLTYEWFKDSVALPGTNTFNFAPDSDGFYMVQVTDANGCTALSNAVFFDFPDVSTINDIPSGFSPNGDGVNDVFYLERANAFPDTELTIVNRWGNEVYRKVKYQNDWNGTSNNGTRLPDGNYFYLIDFNDGFGPIQGVVLINR